MFTALRKDKSHMIVIQLIKDLFSVSAAPDQAVHPQDPQMV